MLRIGELVRKVISPRFDIASRMALSFWRYEPGFDGGEHRPFSMTIIVRYSKKSGYWPGQTHDRPGCPSLPRVFMSNPA